MKGDSYTVSAFIADGKLQMLDSVRKHLAKWAKSQPDGVELLVEFAHRADKRSNRANRRHWGALITPLAEHLGYDKHELTDLHEALLCLFSGTHKDKLTGREMPNKRSSEMTVEEFREFDEWIVRWAAMEHDVALDVEPAA